MNSDPADLVEADTPTLLEGQREYSRTRILRACRAVAARDGASLRMSDVAAEARVSRRTVFRYFSTREDLLRAAFLSGVDSYGAHMPERGANETLERWLERVFRAVHDMNEKVGRLWWDLNNPSSDPEGWASEALEALRVRRRTHIKQVTKEVWEAAGGQDDPPVELEAAVAILLSAPTTRTLKTDLAWSTEQASRGSAKWLALLVGQLRQEAGGMDPAHGSTKATP